jgi:hypothetical protein
MKPESSKDNGVRIAEEEDLEAPKEDRGGGSLSSHRQETRKPRNKFKTLGQM